MEEGKVFIISGPSGVGKGTIIEALLKDETLDLQRAVNITTRKSRASDRYNKHYIFVDKKTFKKMEEQGLILERNEYGNEYYGTSNTVLKKIVSTGSNALLEVDVNGATSIKGKIPTAILIFIYADLKDIERRLKAREDVSPAKIRQRLATAKKELKMKNKYDYNVLNPEGRPEEAVSEIKKIVEKEIG